GYRNAVNDSTANKYTNTMNKSVSNIAADTFQDATARNRVSVKIACEEVTQMKNRKITVPCVSSSGMCSAPCVRSRMSNGIKSVVRKPVNHVSREKPSCSCWWPGSGKCGSCRALWMTLPQFKNTVALKSP